MEALIWPSLLLVFGLGLVMAEVFLPAGGLIGLLAAACLIGSCYLACAASSTIGFRWVLVEGITVPMTWVGTFYGLSRTKLGRRIYLQPPTGDDLADGDQRVQSLDRVGCRGRVLTPLRPSGMVDVEGRRTEAMAESGMIGAGAAVTVVAVRSGRVVVRED